MRPAPPAALVDTLSESLDAIVARAPEPPPEHSSLAPTQPSPTTVEPSAPTSIMPGPAPVAELPTLVEALGQRVQVAGGAGPLWAFALIAVALALASMALTSGSCSALIARSSAPRARPDHQPAPSATVAVLPSAPSPEAAKPGTRGRPAVDTAAIEARSAAERSVDDVLALSAARADEKRSGLVGAQDDPARLRAAVSDPDTMREALGAMARMSSPLGPDLLYSAWTTRKKGDPAAAIAEALLSPDEVRKRASPALLVALDLRAAESCDAAKAALGRAAEHGDRRVVPLLGRFSQKSGCGEGKRDDCWPCLREGDDLKTAAKAAGKRAPPKP
ncbi:MAG: hypothetical protein IT377_02340 [Polyangiaceae bacterium]|nr:hypothetical protein [Polyangiaceae bacterium]